MKIRREFGSNKTIFMAMSKAEVLSFGIRPSSLSNGDSDASAEDPNFREEDEEAYVRVNRAEFVSKKWRELIRSYLEWISYSHDRIRSRRQGDCLSIFVERSDRHFKIFHREMEVTIHLPSDRVLWVRDENCNHSLFRNFIDNATNRPEVDWSVVNVYRMALSVLSEVSEHGQGIVVYGRDCWYLHHLMEDRGIPHLYLEGVSRTVLEAGGDKLAKWIVHKIGGHIGTHHRRMVFRWFRRALHVDTGFRGSVPRGAMERVSAYLGRSFQEPKLGMLSADDESQQLFPEDRRCEVLKIEHSPKLYLRPIGVRRNGSPILKRSGDWKRARALLEAIREAL